MSLSARVGLGGLSCVDSARRALGVVGDGRLGGRSRSRQNESGKNDSCQNVSTTTRSERGGSGRASEAVAMLGLGRRCNRAEEKCLEAAATRVGVGIFKTEKSIDVRDVLTSLWVEAI